SRQGVQRSVLDLHGVSQFAGPASVRQLAGGVGVLRSLGVDGYSIEVLFELGTGANLVTQGLEQADKALHGSICRDSLRPVRVRKFRLPPGILVACCPGNAVIAIRSRAGGAIAAYPQIRKRPLQLGLRATRRCHAPSPSAANIP